MAHTEGSRNAEEHSCQGRKAEALVSHNRKKDQSASVQNRTKGKPVPKARLKHEDKHARDGGTEKILFWTANPGVYEAAALCAEQ